MPDSLLPVFPILLLVLGAEMVGAASSRPLEPHATGLGYPPSWPNMNSLHSGRAMSRLGQ